MIAIRNDNLRLAFPEVHADAVLDFDFQRTLRIPDNDEVHFLPPGLGSFPLRNIDRYADTAPAHWRERGGVMLPMFQSEAMWINFHAHDGYPFLVKIAAGGINAVTGETWNDDVTADPQNYLVLPDQPWLDGFCVTKGEIRQFVAMPLGQGYSAEEQITGKADVGGLQLVVYPMKAVEWEKIKKERDSSMRYCVCDVDACQISMGSASDMGLSAGGRMRQEIYDDDYDFNVWDLEHPRRCFVHIANSLTWRAITGEAPPTMPPTARQYADAGLPWFDWYDDAHTAVGGSATLAGLKTVKDIGQEKGESPLPENNPVTMVKLKPLGPGHVREWAP